MDQATNNVLYAVWLEKEVGRILEQDASTRPWSSVDKSKLPRQAFLWVEDPDKKTTWHLPYREGAGGIDSSTGMYRQVGPVNLAALRAISAAAAGARTGSPMNVPPQIKSKIKKLLQKYRIGQQKESRESGMKRKEIIETSISNQFASDKLNKEENVITDVAILRPTSVNSNLAGAQGRIYSRKALESVARMANGKKAYVNHATRKELEDNEGVRKVQELIGYFENVKVGSDETVRGDLHYLGNHKDWIEPLVEQMADKIGNSIHGWGDIVYDEGRKKEIVEDMNELASVDLVTETGSTVNLFESNHTMQEDEDMDYSLLTIKELKAERPDIIEAIQEGIKKQMDTSEELKQLGGKVTSLEEKNKGLEKTNDEFVVKEQAREKEQKVLGLLKESKLKEDYITEAFTKALRNAESEEEMKQLIEDRKKLVESAKDGVKSMGDETVIVESKEDVGDWEKIMERAIS